MEIWKVSTRPEIVYEDKDFLIIHKPWGLIVHPRNKNDKSYSVAQWFVENYPHSKNVGDLERPGIVHRLDRETSGLMILAKTPKSFDYFKKLFQDRKIKKTYVALVSGKVADKDGVITAPLGRIGVKRTIRIVGKKLLDSKEATTEYRVLKRLKNFTLLEVRPLTGRTHQIRVHLKSIGHPVMCDRVYGGKNMVCPPGLDRLFLHAQKLEFTAPSGRSMVVETDLPEKLQNFLNSVE
ncbi:MAG: hypothetical protein A2750_00935 [Candidatus Yanofskybacteria bacterium RIFCSPHIGHO2_01_FULL_45_42]|uniref:Pseudouridine synthase n=3 Tax=Candidatus Yanofskyibacteriota TaxID=1752733 RepID=A0A1F8F4G8_9BACT|nr:MAG: hypothetical protein A2750_00935 [Candidatus Yanofskybacteria bacterium RIFCSPHIGHO2_01_FULL_45_42]OGN15480.1 MAG: hypothetical protein A3C81_01125 [Candidatus Yanofskybacteria bacterium RIFCSPHIGHO2_02_FULL_46_19]OGN27173.1 MAG: hypothetical protein A3B17_01040 [Candidatus Yanofskybacteria bacterium RIFCSPLOWO2_01_FULL_45_72]OGN31849.1 MAG: hypothetical protein A3J01_01670 [Candidatus Yanofskybacteria bacterium RIFCSPLOWO2_02_FULL_45_18]